MTRDKMDLAVNIAIGSSAQIALFVAPVLVLLSFVLGPFPMALGFNGLEVGAILLAVLVAYMVTHEGESTWFEGLQLLGVYAVLGASSSSSPEACPLGRGARMRRIVMGFNRSDAARRASCERARPVRCHD